MLDLEVAKTLNTITDFDADKDSLSFKNVFDANGNASDNLSDLDASIQSINNIGDTEAIEITMKSSAQIVIENFGVVGPNVDGLGDLPDLNVQIDVM